MKQSLPEFAGNTHALITRAALGGKVPEHRIELVVLGNVIQDMYQTESAFHCDNCAFPDAAAYVEREWATVRETLGPYPSVALAAFGRVLHVVQDFYSHSDWVEKHVEEEEIPLWNWDLKSLPMEIVSGEWTRGFPNRCPQGAPSHAALNKDCSASPRGATVIGTGPHEGKTYFQLAFETAARATAAEFEKLAETAGFAFTEDHDPGPNLAVDIVNASRRRKSAA